MCLFVQLFWSLCSLRVFVARVIVFVGVFSVAYVCLSAAGIDVVLVVVNVCCLCDCYCVVLLC